MVFHVTVFIQSKSCFHARVFNFSYYAADNDVMEDHEIQGFANEVSFDGLVSNGGQGKVLIFKFNFCFLLFMLQVYY